MTEQQDPGNYHVRLADGTELIIPKYEADGSHNAYLLKKYGTQVHETSSYKEGETPD